MKEKQFEEHIEAALLSPEGGYTKGADEYDTEAALYTNTLLRFVKETQEKAWRKYTRLTPHNPEGRFIQAFKEHCAKEGILSVLRNGLKTAGGTIRVCYFKPESGLNDEDRARYAANRVEVYRQWFYSADCTNSVDMVLALNGIPVIAFELKNQMTGQTVENAKRQWQHARDPQEPCFRFNNRILAYFCIDLNEVYMTTRLAGDKTSFLPFNQGSAGAGKNGGKGNPPAADGDFAVAYMWKEVFTRDSLLDILHRFINLEGEKDMCKGRLIFPRYHQLDVVHKLVAHVREHGTGHHYLIQHSAGSGKSNSIAWVAHRLASLHDREDNAIFSSIIVVTDRTVLDAQLRATIQGHAHVRGSVVAIDDKKTSQDLKSAINDGKRIIITTLQKFPVIYQEVEHVAGRRFGIIIDEAHSSQGGSAAASMKAALVDMQAALKQYAEEEELAAEELDVENKIVREMMAHGRHENMSFFAFTATPKETTLQQFCEQDGSGPWRPFHIYSMRQAIEEGFILDVLRNYTTYNTCYKLVRQTTENEDLPSSKASRLIRRYAMLHPENIRQKAEIIVETFRETTQHKIRGRGKMMVVTSSRQAAVLYFRAVKAYAEAEGYAEVRPMVAFSGTVTDEEGEELSESRLNVRPDGSHISETQTKEEFHNNFNILIVAEKYQTGFDEPLLHTMIVDKKLRDVKCVQTLSRLNRTANGKVDTFVLDFANTQEDIREAFQPFYQETLLEGELNIDLLYQTKQELAQYHVYDEGDVQQVVRIYEQESNEVVCTARIIGLLTPIIRTYEDLLEDDQYDFRRKLRSFVKWYAHIAQIVRLNDTELHGEYIFTRFLLKLLPNAPGEKVDLEGKIAMEYYKLKETARGEIQLKQENGILTPGAETGAGGATGSRDTLDELLERINEKMKGDFTEADRIVIRTVASEMKRNPSLHQSAQTMNRNVFGDIFKKEFDNVTFDCYKKSMEGFESLMTNDAKRERICQILSGEIYRIFRGHYPDIEMADLEAAEPEV